MPVFLSARLVAAVLFAQVSAGPSKGSLVVVGGGKIGPAIVERFVSLAGGPDANLVLIPTAAEDRGLDLGKLAATFAKQFGLKHVTVLHTRERNEADSEAFVAPLRQARGVWFGGGRQWRLVDSYLNTLTQRELEAVLERGGVIGGTSAGATIQGSYLVRGAREGNQIMMAKGYEEGFGYLKKVAVDQHLIRRRREQDLVGVIAAHPDLLGIGIDESTAIIVTGDRFEVIGDSQVGIYDGQGHDGKRYYFLSRGACFDLKTRTPISPR